LLLFRDLNTHEVHNTTVGSGLTFVVIDFESNSTEFLSAKFHNFIVSIISGDKDE
jgi:hypothetical protein